MSTKIVEMPFKQQSEVSSLLRNMFLYNIPGQFSKPTAIYRMFLINIVQTIHDKTLTPLQVICLRDNLSFLDQEAITYFIPLSHPAERALFIEEYTKNNEAGTIMYNVRNSDEPLISNTVVWEILQAISKKRGIPHNLISTVDEETLHEVMQLSTKIQQELRKNGQQYGKSSKNKTRKNNSPYSKLACPYGANCYRKNPDHFREFSHPGKKGGKRTSKKVYKCIRQTRKKYLTRSSPPYPAQECPHQKKKGNDGHMYISKDNEYGIFRWVKQ